MLENLKGTIVGETANYGFVYKRVRQAFRMFVLTATMLESTKEETKCPIVSTRRFM